MSQDRTGEFLSLAKSLGGGVGSSSLSSLAEKNAATSLSATRSKNNNNNNSNNNSTAYSEIRAFHSTAAGISRDIAATSALLTELANRVRQQSSSMVHNDLSEQQETDQLVVRIKMSIENLNSRLDQAAVFIQQQKRTLGRHSQAAQESANLVDGLKTEFAEAATGFKKVLQERTDNMKETTDFQRTVYGGAKRSNGGGARGHEEDDDDDMEDIPNMSSALTTPPPVYSFNATNKGHTFPMLDLTSSMMAPGESTSSLPRPHGIRSSTSGISDYSSNAHYDNYTTNTEMTPLTPLDIQRMDQEQREQFGGQLQLIPDQDYLQQRADAMSTVEANIVELGAIFNKLAVMVNEHRELVQRVEDNVEDANTNINLSLNVLTDTLTSLRTNRALAFRVFSVLVVFIIAFIVFFA